MSREPTRTRTVVVGSSHMKSGGRPVTQRLLVTGSRRGA
eukprot:COSAG02_NODE_33430_length_500_cov_0.840399_1_plen_38_part_10